MTRYLLFILTILLCSAPLPALAGGALPVDGVVTSGIGWRLDPFGSGKLAFHRGIDIAVPTGTAVRATRGGKVIFAGERRGYGATVIVAHDNGDRTLYGHNSKLNVRSGELVEAGAVLAFSGNSGRSTGPHVHYEQIAGGGPLPAATEEAGEVAAADPHQRPQVLTGEERRLLEQQIDESLRSLLNNIKSEINGG
ncbi:M23 family metallopeptidase [Geomonas propionica]|uniref:M23 family metallopeptidase n=1 Tax=Geomonas propionica TaxID=2798582 RepID=A0ABS0YQ90_9BACT|nr:M23 family metallopeptidase [Geomonas propionica]MBJ6800127.1 M23 family metallopeptidase [Geomonas propionica]